jgi:hypothetical protein
VLLTPEGPLWGDLEEVCLGPREWDIACFHAPARFSGANAVVAEALRGYGLEPDPDPQEALDELRILFGACWIAVTIERGLRERFTSRQLEWLRDRVG